MMTPLEPLAPYMEFAAASLSTVIDSMSWVGMEFRLPSYGTPSTTRSGDCDADTEPSPRMMMLAEEPGVPDELDVCRPATAPSSDLEMLVDCIFCNFSPLTCAADPTKEDFFCTP